MRQLSPTQDLRIVSSLSSLISLTRKYLFVWCILLKEHGRSSLTWHRTQNERKSPIISFLTFENRYNLHCLFFHWSYFRKRFSCNRSYVDIQMKFLAFTEAFINKFTTIIYCPYLTKFYPISKQHMHFSHAHPFRHT